MSDDRRNIHSTLPSSISFFKIVTSTNLQHGNIRVPNAFTEKYSSYMSNPMFFKTPDDKEWKIYLSKKDGDIWFQKGWKEFATHYSLGHGHMVVFQYHKTSHFDVHLFNRTTLEIEYHVNDGNQHEQNNLDEQLPCKRTRPNPQVDVQVKEESDDTIDGQNMEQEQKKLASKIEEALKKAKSFKTKNPSFQVVMKYSYVNQYMYVPLDFEQKYMKKTQSNIVLQVYDERTWTAKYCMRRISTGWTAFASDNNLKVGDVCLFEMINRKNYAFKVLIFRLDEEQHSPPPQDEVNWIETARISKVESKAIVSCEGRKATLRSSLQASPHSFTNDEAKIEAKKIALTLENPSFIIYLNSSHWDVYKPRINKSFSREYFCNKKIVQLQFGKKLWPVKLYSCPSEPASKLSDGWSRFAEENKLQAGDACVLELINKKRAVLDVHIFRGCNSAIDSVKLLLP